jgi:hypothetical protein
LVARNCVLLLRHFEVCALLLLCINIYQRRTKNEITLYHQLVAAVLDPLFGYRVSGEVSILVCEIIAACVVCSKAWARIVTILWELVCDFGFVKISLRYIFGISNLLLLHQYNIKYYLYVDFVQFFLCFISFYFMYQSQFYTSYFSLHVFPIWLLLSTHSQLTQIKTCTKKINYMFFIHEDKHSNYAVITLSDNCWLPLHVGSLTAL